MYTHICIYIHYSIQFIKQMQYPMHFIFNPGDQREAGSQVTFRRLNFKEEVKLLTVEWKVMRVPFPLPLSLR